MTKNVAFIDGQNLYMGTNNSEINPWKINLKKFRVYLERKYKVTKAYYFLGYIQESNQDLYQNIKDAGFILKFRKHNSAMLGKKKGNVDTDIVFCIMRKMYFKEDFNKIILVSGDGDYKMLIDFLIQEDRLARIIFPNRKFASSLYKNIHLQFKIYLDDQGIKKKIS